MRRAIRVLVVDDAAMIRKILVRELGADSGIEVVGEARDAFEAKRKVEALQPDVMTLDVEMPGMNGVEFLQLLMPNHPLPVVMVSAVTKRGQQVTLDALAAGAVDFVTKPALEEGRSLDNMLLELKTKIRIASVARVTRSTTGGDAPEPVIARRRPEAGGNPVQVIAIGASTGGPEALRKILQNLPETTPGILVVQHMPAGFIRSFAERLDDLSPMRVMEAEDGQPVAEGTALIAPGDKHLQITGVGGRHRVRLTAGEPVGGHCPSVNVLMKSVAERVKENAIGLLMTGMGRDGAEGLLAMREAGARTLAQDEESSVVFGMPKEAHACGAAERLVSLRFISGVLTTLVNRSRE